MKSFKFKLLVVFFLFLLAFAGQASAYMEEYTIASYYFDGNLIDETGKWNATNAGSTNNTGYIFDSREFDGSSQYLDTTITNADLQGDFAFTGWFYLDTITAQQQILNSDNCCVSANRGFFLETQSAGYSISNTFLWGVNTPSGQSMWQSAANTATTGSWIFLAGSWDSSTNTLKFWKNNATSLETYARSTSATGSVNNNAEELIIGKNTVASSGYFNGRVDELTFYNTSLVSDNVTTIYNYYTQGEQWPWSVPQTDNLTITLYNQFDLSHVFNATIQISNQNFTNTTGNVYYTTVPLNETDFFNISIFSPGNYYNKNYTNQNISSNLNLYVNPKYFFSINELSNFTTVNNTNYTRTINAEFNVSCNNAATVNVLTYANSNLSKTSSVTCGGNGVTSLQTFTYTHINEGEYTVYWVLNTSENNPLYNKFSNNYTFVSDLEDPVISRLDFATTEGFGSISNTFNMQCYDNIFPTLTYNMSFEGSNIFYGNLTNNTLQTNTTSEVYSTGAQTLTGVCSDPFSSTTNTSTQTIYTNNITIIDEQDNTVFDVSNLTGARVYYDDNSTFFDFKANSTSSVVFSSATTSKLRFEFVYADGTIITRYADVSLIPTETLRVCAFKDNNIQAYQQLLTSTTTQAVAIKNVFSDCYVGVDYTRFAFENSQILNSYTITSLYYLYKYNNGNPVYLASIDGGQSGSIALDVLEFTGEEYDVSLVGPLVSVSPYTNTSVKIVYVNPQNNSDSATINIVNMDTGSSIFSLSLSDPNALTLYYDYSTLSPATYNDTTLFKITVTSDTDGTERTVTKYFNADGRTGIMNPKLAFVLSLFLFVFGITFVRANLALSWFGIMVLIGSLIVANLAVLTTGLTLLVGIEVIALLFITVTTFTGNSEVNIIR